MGFEAVLIIPQKNRLSRSWVFLQTYVLKVTAGVLKVTAGDKKVKRSQVTFNRSLLVFLAALAEQF